MTPLTGRQEEFEACSPPVCVRQMVVDAVRFIMDLATCEKESVTRPFGGQEVDFSMTPVLAFAASAASELIDVVAKFWR